MANKGIFLAGGIALAAAGACSAAFQYGTVETEKFTVVDALEVTKSDGDGGLTKEKRIKVITEAGCPETFTVEDSLFHWQWYSSNLHALFSDAVTTEGREDNTFEGIHYGWRNGFLSMMENVVEADRINEGPYVLRADAKTACKM